jgi:hypothetical protein
MCSKSNPLVVFALDLMSTYEGEHTIFGLLEQANLTQNDVLQFHPLPLTFLNPLTQCIKNLHRKRGVSRDEQDGQDAEAGDGHMAVCYSNLSTFACV